MDEFYQIITELRPLIVQNCVLLHIILRNGQILIFLLQNIRWRGMLQASSAFIEEKRGDIVLGILYLPPPSSGRYSVKLLQFYADSFETLQVFRSWFAYNPPIILAS